MLHPLRARIVDKRVLLKQFFSELDRRREECVLLKDFERVLSLYGLWPESPAAASALVHKYERLLVEFGRPRM